MMRKDDNSIVSVIIVSCNRSNTIVRAIESVLKQSYRFIELIIVDNGSEEETLATIRRYEDRARIVFLRKNLGAPAARNIGAKCSDGSLLAFLDDDDEWREQKIERQVDTWERNGRKHALISCWMNYYDHETNELINEHRKSAAGKIYPDVFSNIYCGGTSTFLIEKSAYFAVGGFDEMLPTNDDQELVLRIANIYDVLTVEEVMVNMYINHGSERLSQVESAEMREKHLRSWQYLIKKHRAALAEHPEHLSNYLMKEVESLWACERRAKAIIKFIGMVSMGPFWLRKLPRFVRMIRKYSQKRKK